MTHIWHQLPQPFFVLAPMEAVTDVVFRQVVAKAAAPDLYMTEFTNATGWMHAGDKAIGGRLVKEAHENERLIAQLWGADPAAMAKLASHCAEQGFAGIDINMGCPDKSAVNSGGGAGMCRNPKLAGEMIAAAKTSDLPVSVKTRLGYSRIDEWREWLGFLFQQDIVNLTIHLRTKKEMSKVPAHFELIDDIVALRDELAPHTLLTINGDIEDRQYGEVLAAKHPGVNGIMIGRGIFHNPFAFATPDESRSSTSSDETSAAPSSAAAYATDDRREAVETDDGGEEAKEKIVEENGDEGKQQLLNLLHYHLDLYDQYSHLTNRPFETLKRFFKIYIRDFAGAAELRHELMQTKTTEEVRSLLSQPILDS